MYNLKNKECCVQISNTLINQNIDKTSIENQYYEKIYSIKGYNKNIDFWEIPLWIAKINSIIETDLYICKDINQTIKDLANYDEIFFSVLDVNKKFIFLLIDLLPDSILIHLGGYIDFDKNYQFKYNKQVLCYKSIQEFCTFNNLEYTEKVNYSLFKNMKIIPRLEMSSGCLYNCKFCTVENQIKEYTIKYIFNQIKEFKKLNFELIYINDKTFGQAKNHQLIESLYWLVKSTNKNFQGFIIQTTARDALKIEPEVLKYIKYAEIGVESFNNDILKNTVNRTIQD